MRRYFVVIIMFLSCWLSAGKLSAEPRELERARQQGAQGQVTLRVVDSTGLPVEKAVLSVAFWASDSSADAVVSEGQTNTNGYYVASGKTIHSMNYEIKKKDYYTTTGQYWFYPGEGRSVLDGRWQPWNPTNTVVLKEKRDPVAMYASYIDDAIPVRDIPIGFDLESGDWVTPYGKGKQADIYFTYKASIQDFWTGSYELTLACSNRLNGFIRKQKDMESEFLSDYEALDNGYQEQVALCLDRTKNKLLRKEQLGDKEYLMFRVRTVLDDKGKIVTAHYGKIYGPIEFGRIGKIEENRGGVRFTYYFNPTANDRNLEFDPGKNLLDVKRRVYQP